MRDLALDLDKPWTLLAVILKPTFLPWLPKVSTATGECNTSATRTVKRLFQNNILRDKQRYNLSIDEGLRGSAAVNISIQEVNIDGRG
jgi:hypothetical protein